ncbi:MAG: GNAT family N-acetyltransferase [Pseudomonadota bacterium]|nr:GNAT family N-acetyltransferase [Pseudomonadota bacterium]
MAALPYVVRSAAWPDDEAALRVLRHEVFVVEQGVPETLEWDGLDAQCRHAIAHTGDAEIIACGRLLPDGHIGRMAVRRDWRRRGVGAAVLLHLVDVAAHAGYKRVLLNAQTHAVLFYRRFGFVPVGDEFMEAGIAHQAMERELG